MPSFEVLLLLGVIGFYIFDSSRLLYSNELVFIRGRRQWGYKAPGSNWRLMGKLLYIPNPLTPATPQFLVSWSIKEWLGQQENEASLQLFFRALGSFNYMLVSLAFLMLIFLPAQLVLYGTSNTLLLLFGLIYINIILILVQVFRNRVALGVSEKYFVSLALESLLCAPFALNILRKICLRFKLPEDPLEFSKKVFSPSTFYRLLETISNKLDEKLSFVQPGSSRYLALQSYRNHLREIECQKCAD